MSADVTGGVNREDDAPDVTHRWMALVVLGLAQLMDIVDNTIMNIACAQRPA